MQGELLSLVQPLSSLLLTEVCLVAGNATTNVPITIGEIKNATIGRLSDLLHQVKLFFVPRLPCFLQ